LAIRQAAASNVNITYKILYNDAVAMTGGQPVDGNLSIEQMIMQLRGEGIKRIALVSDTPGHHEHTLAKFDGLSISHRDRLLAVEKELREVKGTSILIYEQTCAAEKRRRRRKGTMRDPDRRVIINPEVCEGCGDCSVQSNCLSVLPHETELGRKRKIDQSACNKDFSCLSGFCPSFVTVTGGTLKKNTLPETQGASELPEPAIASIDAQPWNIVVTGIGGTGVLTLASIVAMAAHIEGKGCATLNQTGLAQKFGAVVSHVRVGKQQEDINAVRITAGDADLLIGCDLVVASGDEAMAKVNQQRSHAIINTYKSVPADFVSNPDLEFPGQAMQDTIAAEVGSDKVSFIDATKIATGLLGDSIASNLFMLGFAYQQGLLPVKASSIEEAISLNGVAIAFNQQAFVWGRRAAINLDEVKDHANLKAAFTPLEKVDEIIEDRYQRLVKYQNVAYARRYKKQLERVQKLDNIDGQTGLSKNVARNLYKLMAYKDEYEVARLFSDGQFKQQVKNQFSGQYRLEFHLAPPLLSAKDKDTGLPRKRRFGAWMMPVYTLLAKLKILRGTKLDLFGYTDERKLERKLIEEYVSLLDEFETSLTADNYAQALELSALPEQIRGYGHIKHKHIEQQHVRRQRLLAEFRGETRAPVKFIDAAA